jgi:acetyl-CoA acyltransferase
LTGRLRTVIPVRLAVLAHPARTLTKPTERKAMPAPLSRDTPEPGRRPLSHAFLVAGVRTPIGRYGGALSSVRPDDLAAHALTSLLARLPATVPDEIDDIILGCANQAGEDNRNVARMAALLAGLGNVTGTTINRLCGSGLDAVGQAARAIRCGEADLIIAGGVESMSRAPFVLPKATEAFSRNAEVFDTTIGWRFVNPLLKASCGIDSMPETAENLAAEFAISRTDQDAFALRSQQRALAAQSSGRLAREIEPVPVPQRKGEPVLVSQDEHPRPTTAEQLARLGTPFRKEGGSVTAGNASGVNDGAAALLIASEAACRRHGLNPLARITGMATAAVPPRIMGIGPVPATRRLLSRLGLSLADIGIIELNEAFAAQALAVTRQLGLPDDAAHVNPNGGAIALGHPLGMSGARLALTAAIERDLTGVRHALCTMCIGVGQGIALMLEAP